MQQILGKLGDAKYHCGISRCSTSAPERQPRPSITCSLASTVLIDGVPVHLAELALDQPRAQEVDEHLLLVLVIGRVAGRDFAAPSRAKAPST